MSFYVHGHTARTSMKAEARKHATCAADAHPWASRVNASLIRCPICHLEVAAEGAKYLASRRVA